MLLRRIMAVLCASFIYLPIGAQDVPAKIPQIPRGKVVPVILETTVSSETSHKGDPVVFRTISPLIVDGYTFLPAGAEIELKVGVASPIDKTNCLNGILGLDGFSMAQFPGGQKFDVLYREKMPVDASGKMEDVADEQCINKENCKPFFGHNLSERILYFAMYPAAAITFPITAPIIAIELHCNSKRFAGKPEAYSAGTKFYLIFLPVASGTPQTTQSSSEVKH
jgi:hypothetical protein